jgi:hypothetical protein
MYTFLTSVSELCNKHKGMAEMAVASKKKMASNKLTLVSWDSEVLRTPPLRQAPTRQAVKKLLA